MRHMVIIASFVLLACLIEKRNAASIDKDSSSNEDPDLDSILPDSDVSAEIGRHHGFESESSEEHHGHDSCQCGPNSCTKDGTYQKPCLDELNLFIQCTNGVCTNSRCPPKQVWDFTRGQCGPCPEGTQIDKDGDECECPKGFTFNITHKFKGHGKDGMKYHNMTRVCVPCPTGSVTDDDDDDDDDDCECENNSILVIDQWMCKQCPTGSTAIEERNKCRCNNNAMIWNQDAWQCQPIQ